MTYQEYLNNLPNSLASETKELCYSENEIIIEQASQSRYIYWIKKGLIKAYHTNERGQEFLFGIFGKNELFGEVEYFSATKYTASVETITRCQIIQIPYAVFTRILKSNYELFYDIGRTLARRFIKITERTVEYSYYPLEYLLSKYLVNEADSRGSNTITASKENLANYFGTNQRSINRIFKKLSEDGIIKANKDEIEIISPERLAGIYKSY